MAVTYTNSEEETQAYAQALGKSLESGSFISLSGDLGAGKTAFTKGIALGLGIEELIVSPTFTLLRVYETGRLPLYHFDVYRLGSAEELSEIGFYEFAFGNGVCVCEWADLIEEELPPERIQIVIQCIDENKRKITLEKIGE